MWTLFLSLRYFLTKHHKEGMISLISLISILGVAVGVASLIVVISVMNGFDAEVKDKIIGTYAHVVVTKDDGIKDSVKLASDMEKLPGVVSVSTFITGQAVLECGNSFSGVLVKGIDPQKEAAVSSIIDYTGGFGRDLKPGMIILGSELMRSEGVSVGDMVEIIVPYTPKDIEKHELKVLGTFTSGRYDYDANIVIVSDETARGIFRMGDEITGIALKAADSMKVNDLKVVLQDALGPEYAVRTWMDLDRNLVAALALEKKMMFLILALIVMVACFNISGSLIMMVMEKTKDIGVLKAIGASSLGVSVVFILQGAFTGALGIITGVLSGLFIANKVNYIADLIEKLTGMTVFPSDVYYFTEIPVKISSGDVYAIVAVTSILALSAGFYPAWKASRLDPVEAIRYE